MTAVETEEVRKILMGMTRNSTSPPFLRNSKDTRDLEDILKDNTIKGRVKLRLSINDYTRMCESDELRKLMAEKLNTKVEYLTDYCFRVKGVGKHIEHIYLSKKIFEKKISLLDLPLDKLEYLVEKFESIRLLKYDLIDWIKKDSQKVRGGETLEKALQKTYTLSANYNAIDYIVKNGIEIHYDTLSQNTNPKAVPLLVKRIEEEREERQMLRRMSNKERQRLTDESNDDLRDNHIDWKALSQNTNKIVPLLVERIKDEGQMSKKELKDNHVDWKLLSQNTNPDILQLLVERIEEEKSMSEKYKSLQGKTKKEMSGKEKQDYKDYKDYKDNSIDWKSLWANINIFKLFKLLETDSRLSADYVKSLKTPDYSALSANPSDEALTILEANKRMIDYGNLSGNTNLRAINLLIAKLNKNSDDTNIDWSKLSGNSSASEIFKMENEKYKSKINMDILSSNSSDWAIDILKANPSKINYHNLSGNINRRAIELFYYTDDDGKQINHTHLIYRINFASNPSIFIEK
jgi:hypothetical protein